MANGGKTPKMTDEQIINALDGADVFLRNRANSKPAPLNEYDIAELLDIAKICDKASNIIKQQQKQLNNYSHNVRNMAKDFIEQQKVIYQQQTEIKRLKETVEENKELNAKIKRYEDLKKAENILDFLEQNAFKRSIYNTIDTIKRLENEIEELQKVVGK